jgi:hypothetical protein
LKQLPNIRYLKRFGVLEEIVLTQVSRTRPFHASFDSTAIRDSMAHPYGIHPLVAVLYFRILLCTGVSLVDLTTRGPLATATPYNGIVKFSILKCHKKSMSLKACGRTVPASQEGWSAERRQHLVYCGLARRFPATPPCGYESHAIAKPRQIRGITESPSSKSYHPRHPFFQSLVSVSVSVSVSVVRILAVFRLR